MLSPNALWIVLLIIFAIIIVVITIAICQHKIFDQNSPTASNTTLPNTCEQQGIAGLIDVSNIPCCCAANGFGGQSKYLSGYNMIISPGIPVSYLNVCIGYCDTFVPDQTGSGTCTSASNPQAQLQFDQCVNLLQPNNCNGSASPIGYSGSLFYYAQLANVPPCTQTWDCVDLSLCS